MSNIPPKKGPSDKFCPFWKEKMSKVCHKCPMWCRYERVVKGADGRSKTEIDWDCGIAALSPQMLGLQTGIYGNQMATESLRNAVVEPPPAMRTMKLIEDKK